MIIDDHINMLGSNPLIGANDDRFGVRVSGHDRGLFETSARLADEAAAAKGIAVSHGVYVAVHGPSYETPAEIRFIAR
jgi:purine-nucleoside phosphorylase